MFVSVHLGFETYGKVKRVGNTYIRTRFFMISGLPIWPRESYFATKKSKSSSVGIPFVMGYSTSEACGIPLARLDRASVVMAYLRGVFGGLVVVGCIGMFMAVATWFSGQRVDDFARVMGLVLAGALAVGILGGLATYSLPSGLSRRDGAIRQACGMMLEVCADPKYVRHDIAQELVTLFEDMHDPGEAADDGERQSALLAELILTRSQLAFDDSPGLEQRTDELLEALATLPARLTIEPLRA